MNQAFTAILQKLAAEQGKEALLNPAKCKALLADYTRNEYKKESRLLLQAIEAGTVKAIDSATDIVLSKRQQVKMLREEYFLAEEIARDLVDTLALVLRGDASKTEPPAATTGNNNNNKTIPQKEMYYISYNYRGSGPYEKSAVEAMITNRQITAKHYILLAGSSQWQPITALFTFPTAVNDFVRVEGGTFQRGSNSGESNEKPMHNVTLKSFCIGKYEVTQKEWVKVMGHNPSSFKGDNRPVENVSWDDAVEYCNKRSKQEGLTPAYQNSNGNIVCDFRANGYRLPTEAEWEYAAKDRFRGYTYAGSDNVEAVAWYADNSGRGTHDVGTKAPNGLGIYDMNGNVHEWCWDWYESYSSRAQTNPVGASSGGSRVFRGGSWSDLAQNCRSAYRYGSNPSSRYHILGFRLALNAD